MQERARPQPYGGQAVVEGVMIRGPRTMCIAVRDPDGRIVTESDVLQAPYSDVLRKIPLVRGVVTLYETFTVGIRSLYWSSKVAAGRPDEKTTKAEIALSVATLGAAAAIFFAGPVLLTRWLGQQTGSEPVEVVAEGLLRMGMLVGYIWFIGRLPEVKRVFAYHAAEHRTIHAYEHGEPLTVGRVRAYANAHPRCGTAFLLTVGALSLVAFVALGTPPLVERLVERAILTPVIAAVAYEFIRASQTHGSNPVFNFLQAPNLWLQRLTTRDPEDAQIEVAIAALNTVLALEAALPAAARAPVGVEADELT